MDADTAGIGERVKQLRKRADLSQVEFTARVTALGGHGNQSALSEFERGQKGVSVETLIAIARVLDTSLDYLCGLTDHAGAPAAQLPAPSQPIQQPSRQEHLQSILSDLAALTPAQQKEFAHLVSLLYDGIIAKSATR